MFVPFGAHRAASAQHPRRVRPPARSITDAHRIDLRGQSITVASPGARPGSTVLTAGSLTYDIEQPPTPAHPDRPSTPAAAPATFPGFLPRLAVLTRHEPGGRRPARHEPPVDMGFDDIYLGSRLRRRRRTARRPSSDWRARCRWRCPASAAAGWPAPTSVAKALSRTLGPVSRPDALQAARSTCRAFANTRILGTIPLLDLLPHLPISFDAAAAGTPPTQAQLDDRRLPRQPAAADHPARAAGAAVPDLVETRFVWKPPLRDRGTVLPFLTLELAGGDLLLDATTRLVRGGCAERRACSGGSANAEADLRQGARGQHRAS